MVASSNSLNTLADWAVIVSVFIWPLLIVIGRVIWKHLKQELYPNGGSSLRDAVDRSEKCAQEANKRAKRAERIAKETSKALTDLFNLIKDHFTEVE